MDDGVELGVVDRTAGVRLPNPRLFCLGRLGGLDVLPTTSVFGLCGIPGGVLVGLLTCRIGVKPLSDEGRLGESEFGEKPPRLGLVLDGIVTALLLGRPVGI